MSAQVSLEDQWRISVPAGTPLGPLTLPVSLHLEGSISPVAVIGFQFRSFVDYFMYIGPPGSYFSLQASGSILTTGAFAQTFTGNVTWQYTGQPLEAAIGLSLFVPGFNEGVLDFYNSATASVLLPAGYSATTSSGLPLVFAPVPEPSTAALLLAGLACVWLWCRAGQRWRVGRATRKPEALPRPRGSPGPPHRLDTTSMAYLFRSAADGTLCLQGRVGSGRVPQEVSA